MVGMGWVYTLVADAVAATVLHLLPHCLEFFFCFHVFFLINALAKLHIASRELRQHLQLT
jgi:hypothetical protein